VLFLDPTAPRPVHLSLSRLAWLWFSSSPPLTVSLAGDNLEHPPGGGDGSVHPDKMLPWSPLSLPCDGEGVSEVNSKSFS
jgi:hypothetical protein